MWTTGQDYCMDSPTYVVYCKLLYFSKGDLPPQPLGLVQAPAHAALTFARLQQAQGEPLRPRVPRIIKPSHTEPNKGAFCVEGNTRPPHEEPWIRSVAESVARPARTDTELKRSANSTCRQIHFTEVICLPLERAVPSLHLKTTAELCADQLCVC